MDPMNEEAVVGLMDAYVNTRYLRLGGDFDSPSPPMTVTATATLQAELMKSHQSMKLLGRSAVASMSFRLDGTVIMPGDTLGTVKVTCKEAYSVSYTAADSDAVEATGRLLHHFTLAQEDGQLLVAGHQEEEVNAFTVSAIMKRQELAERTAILPGKSQAGARTPAKAAAPTKAAAAAPAGPKFSLMERLDATPAQLAILGIAVLVILGGLTYTQAPRSSRTDVCLQTGETRKTTWFMGIQTSQEIKTSAASKWAAGRIPSTPDSRVWLIGSSSTRGPFGRFSTKDGHPLVYVAINVLTGLMNLDQKSSKQADKAIEEYLTLAAEIDPNDRGPVVDVMNRSRLLVTPAGDSGPELPPFAKFAKGLELVVRR